MRAFNLKWIAISLSALMLTQSCSIYHGKTSSVEDAIASKRKVKAKTFDNVTYKFDRLIKEDGKLYGIAKKYSNTRMKLEKWIVNDAFGNNYVIISVPEKAIKGYYLKDQIVSGFLTTTILLITVVALGRFKDNCCY